MDQHCFNFGYNYISRSTLYRRLEEAVYRRLVKAGIELSSTYSELSDSDHDHAIVGIKQNHPNDGERLITGHLYRLEIIFPRARIRASIYRADPTNTAICRSITIRRRIYYVNGPNSLWHVDGHHKLIRWRFVTHGGINGFSRIIVYLCCSTNNQASTLMASFADAVGNYSLPEHVRSDRGGENVAVWHYMLEQHHSESAVLVGSLTHNERIERMWQDVYRCVGVCYSLIYSEKWKVREI